VAPIALIDPGDPPEAFPDPANALHDPPGLLCIGGDLSPERLLSAYRRGIFPWFEAGQPILWWSPDPRAVLYTHELRVARSLRRTLRSGRYRVSIDTAFGGVIRGCAAAPGRDDTWITPAMSAAYRELHALGHAHSVETWENDELVGGLYGVSIGRAFFGESMFARETDASKVALAGLVTMLQACDFRVFCWQAMTRASQSSCIVTRPARATYDASVSLANSDSPKNIRPMLTPDSPPPRPSSAQLSPI